MNHIEQSTLDTINAINDCYPYAAAMLVCVLMERQLKEYIIKNRHQSLKNACINIRGNCLKVIDFEKDKDEEFFRSFIKKLTLGQVETLLNITRDTPSEIRNDLMHSNRFLEKEKNLPKEERHLINKAKYVKAKKCLLQIFEKYSDVPIVEIGNYLMFKP